MFQSFAADSFDSDNRVDLNSADDKVNYSPPDVFAAAASASDDIKPYAVESVTGYTQTTPPLLEPTTRQSSESPASSRAATSAASTAAAYNQPLLIDTNANVAQAPGYYHSKELVKVEDKEIDSHAIDFGSALDDDVDSPLSVRCTTQATVALQLSKPPAHTALTDLSSPYIPQTSSYAPQLASAYGPQARHYPSAYVDRLSYQPQRYYPYSPLPATLPYSNANYQSPYYTSYADHCCSNPQFPPQNYIDVPDITHCNSVYNPHYNVTRYHVMSQQMMQSMDDVSAANGPPLGYEESLGVAGAGHDEHGDDASMQQHSANVSVNTCSLNLPQMQSSHGVEVFFRLRYSLAQKLLNIVCNVFSSNRNKLKC